MYLFFAILIPVFLLLILLGYWRKRKNIQRVRNMCPDDKNALINNLIEPFGYYYISSQDLFTTRMDAWQRDFGYCTLYDRAALHFHMVFDCLPIYFNYRGRTWLFELWKGQYGINTGCEMGLYYADRILEEDELTTTLFTSVGDEDMVKMSFTLYRNGEDIAHLSHKHWWLTAFRMGCFTQPADLSMRATITFPTTEMARAFVNGLLEAGYPQRNICFQCSTVTFSFLQPDTQNSFLRRLRIRLAQASNRFWCKIYLYITRPFHLSIDRLLYLYYYLPFAFRRMLRIRRYKSLKKRKNLSRR